MHVASPILDRLDDLARKQKVHVTRHDLLMAMIAQATIKAFPGLSPTPIGFIYNFNHHLEKSAPLHNTFWPISIPLAQGIEMTHGDDQLIMLAIQIRHAVRAARSPECLELFRERYESMGPQQPLHPANLNPNRPNIQVSSSAHQDWYDISFGPGVKPYYADFHVPVIDLFAYLGWEYHDLIITTKDKEKSGFCIHGSLHREVWRWLEHVRDPSVPTPSQKGYARL
ncbi:hypothetical protein N7508_010386 [Penicillium antarcticum]|uniref:uncharacterized protein n=1 Tax=Penicillium antarcticum TaxID=416450 RepID=UPI0023901264|nr:uncharacterized protein N7508_010386 [Penicillium antarcticum]KAJ5295565.1 hypothetical protein N7508_010386 [Penicillium antarcticum]